MTRLEWMLWVSYAAQDSQLRRIGAGLCVLIFLSVVAMLVWWFQMQSVETLSTAVRSDAQNLALAEQSTEIAKAYDESKARLARLRALEKAPEAVTQAALLNRFKELAARNNVTVLNQQYETASTQGSADRFYLELTTLSTYRALREFLSGTQRLPWLVFIKETSIEINNDRDQRVKSNLRIAVYRGVPTVSPGLRQ